ncbi:glycosyltransferase [Flavobacterium sp. NST-5]|uniref:Glycosyltransferase n=1 Tax=Flavobacterium ichthyis TaxID=2698827 RepID=A0ABW9Z9U2_9FLAO|nr:glycosyltransferase [Flavobacterium ichthyis]NBL65332.1 glycosyltransferase [Flavobacterium ichthyis]
MKILLVGEFSRLHNSLKEGLEFLGHEVKIVATGDDFKKFPMDYNFAAKSVNSSILLSSINRVSRKILKIDLEKIEKAIRFQKMLLKLKNYDVVQIINSDALETYPFLSKKLFAKLFYQNKKISLLICGDETPIVEVQLKNNLKYSVLTPLFENNKYKKFYNYTLKFVKKNHQNLFAFLLKKSNVVVASDLDYVIPLQQTNINFTHIPNPVNVDKLRYQSTEITDKIVIFLGKNKFSALKKGTLYFEEALTIIAKKYPQKVTIKTANSIPYELFQQWIDESHIILDQIYAFDQGYNALEAMAKGKVVFTGAETEFYEYYNLEQTVAVNALPNVDFLVEKLSYLIENPEEITAIAQNARQFIEEKHHYVNVAKKYLGVWNA